MSGLKQIRTSSAWDADVLPLNYTRQVTFPIVYSDGLAVRLPLSRFAVEYGTNNYVSGGNAMSARADILSGKFKDTPAAQQAKRAATSGDAELAELFAKFVGYAAANWDYVAQPGQMTANQLLEGEGRKSPACGTLREALIALIKDELEINDVGTASVESSFLVKTGLECFDPKVKGNVGNYGARGPNDYKVGCVFSKHYFLRSKGKFYDPCMKSVYTAENGPVAGMLEQINKPIGLGRKNPPMFTVGNGRSLIVLMNENYSLNKTTVPGFGATWVILLPKECQDVLDKDGWKLFKQDQRVKFSGPL